MKKIELYDDLLIEQLEQVKMNMISQTKSGDVYLNGSLDYLMTAGGKMLRPAFLLIGSRMNEGYKQQEDELIKLATAIETIHLATLIHDDIIDEANTRRGQESIQAKYGQSYAVYMGDYLLSQSFIMLNHLALEQELAIRLAKAISKICIGDMKQNQMRYRMDVTPYEYIKMVSGKTAILFSIAMSSGAFYLKEGEANLKILARIGYEVGMAFQLVDDLLDYEGDVESLGKEVQVDIIRGNYSMPIIYALQSATECDMIRLRTLLSGKVDQMVFKEVVEIVQTSGAFDQTKLLASRYSKKAMILLEKLPKGETRQLLATIIPKLLSRVN